MNTYQLYMLLFITIYLGLIIGIRSLLLYKATKVDATKNFGKAKESKRAERIIQVALFIMIAIATNYILIEDNYRFLLPFKALEIGFLQTTGFVLSMIGLIFTFIAQLQMNKSWRLGIDKHSSLTLVTNGLFSISRNPIYLALGISFIGFFFIAPNAMSFVFLLLMCYGVKEKIKDEESFLTKKFGKAFQDYTSKVPRWL